MVFFGFLSGTHSPPRSKVITDWMELSGGGRGRWQGRGDTERGPTEPPPAPSAPSAPTPGGCHRCVLTFGEDAGDVDAPQRGDVGEVGLPAGGGVEVPLQGLGVHHAPVVGGVDGAVARVWRGNGAEVTGAPRAPTRLRAGRGTEGEEKLPCPRAWPHSPHTAKRNEVPCTRCLLISNVLMRNSFLKGTALPRPASGAGEPHALERSRLLVHVAAAGMSPAIRRSSQLHPHPCSPPGSSTCMKTRSSLAARME